jgi:multidrug efflux pump subunit AcrA (membrane-fusion protein)
MPVRQRQTLFFLPDLSEMEVQVALNESVIERMVPVLRAHVRFEALPHLMLEGELVSISQIPVQQNNRGEDVRYFVGLVKLDRTAPGLKPGMTAEVDITLPPRASVLVVPHRAIVDEQGRMVCFLPGEDQLVRREVKVGQGTTELVEICEGLSEGEEVVLDPPGRSGPPRSLSGFLELGPVKAADFARVPISRKSRLLDQPPTADPTNRRKNRRSSPDESGKTRERATT